MNKTIYTAIALLLVGIASIVPWADAQQKPNPVIIWCQDSSGGYAPCLGGNVLDYDSGAGTVNQGTVGIVLPASGGPVAGGTSTNPVRIDPTGTTPQPVTQSGSWSLSANQSVNVSQINGVTPLMGSGATGTGSPRVTEATDSQLSAGVGATGDAAATVGSTGSLNAKLRLLTTQMDAIQTAVQLIDNMISGSGANISQINGATPLMGSGATGTGSPRVTEATDSQLSAGVGATGDSAATVGSTGSVNAKLRLITSQLDTMSTALASILTAVQLIDDDQTGASMFHRISVGTTEDEHQVKGSAGRLFSINVTNTNAAARYLRCADQVAASNTPGTTTVWYGMAIPGNTTGAGFTTNFGPTGAAFSTGLTCWIVTGAAESDVAEVAANEINVNYTIK